MLLSHCSNSEIIGGYNGWWLWKALLFMFCINYPLQFLVIISQNHNEWTSGMYLKGAFPLHGRHIKCSHRRCATVAGISGKKVTV